MNKLKKILKSIGLAFAIIPFCIVAAFTLLLFNSNVQTYISGKVSQIISNKIGANVSVGNVFINLFSMSVDLNDIYIADLQDDTVLYAGSIKTRLKAFAISDNYYHFANARIKNLVVNMIADSAGVFNYDFLFSQSDSAIVDTLDSDAKFKIVVDKILFSNLNYKYITKPSANTDLIDFDNLQLSNINLFAKNFSINQKIEIAVEIDSLRADEHCGFNIKQLSTNAFVSTNDIILQNLHLVTHSSDLSADSLNFHYHGFESFSDFCNNVVIGAKINNGSRLCIDDIGRFAEPLYGFGVAPNVSTLVSGSVSKLNIKYLNINYLNDTRLSASGYINGLPDIDRTFFNVDINELSTSKDNINTLHQRLSAEKLIDLPNALSDLGIVTLKANAKGKTEELNLKGTINSNLGGIDTDILVASFPDVTNIKGVIKAHKLNLGSVLTDKEKFGHLSTIDTIDVDIANNGNVDGIIKGTIDSLGLLKYNYSGIAINGKFTQNDFNGLISIKDPNLDLDFAGLLNFGSTIMKAKCSLTVANANLKATNILEDSLDVLRFAITADIEGSTIDNFEGSIKLSEKLVFQRDDSFFYVNDFLLKSYIDQFVCGLPLRKVELVSDYIDIDLQGLVQSDQLSRIINNFAYRIFPSLNYSDTAAITRIKRRLAQNMSRNRNYDFNNPDFQRNVGNNFKFQIDFKQPNKVTNFFMPEISISDKTSISGGFSTLQSHIYVDFVTDSIRYNHYSTNNFVMSVHSLGREFILDITADSIDVAQDMCIKNPSINITAQNDTANFMVSWYNSDTLKTEGVIDGSVIVQQHSLPNHFPIINVSFNPGTFYILNSKWDIYKGVINIDSTQIDVKQFGIYSEKQNFIVDGTISEDPEKTLFAEIQKFDIAFLNKFIPNLHLKGVLSGNVNVKNVYGKIPIFSTYNTIENLVYNDVSLGNVTAKSSFQPFDSIIHIDFFTKRHLLSKELMDKDTIMPIHGFGTCNIVTQEVDFTLKLLSLPFNTFKPFYENYIKSSYYTNISGYARLKGKIDDPKLMAQLSVRGGSFNILSLGTQYDINDSLGITLDNKLIKIHKTTLYSDRKSGNALLEGTISHNNFSNFDMNLKLAVNNFMFLNAKQTDTSLFYGKAFASGNIFLRGNPMRMINVEGRIKTEKNTLVYLPMYGASDVETNNEFITFVTHDTLHLQPQRHGADLTGLQMNLNLEVTPEAEVQVILDQTTGNILKASAQGDLRLVISNAGDFSMFGTLSVVKGEYLFIMQNVISKKFEVVKGGTLRWNGAPQDAVLDLSAVYKLRRVNLFNLMVDEEYRNKKVPVQCLLNINGDLMQPIVSFGVKLEGNYDDIQTQLSNLDEGNINKQVISLLLLSQFQPLPGLQNQGNSMFSDINPGELVSNQINHWLSDISDKVDVGVNYSLGDNATSSELEVALSTQLFDDRVTVSTNVGVGGDSKTTTSNRANNVVGEVEVDVNLNKSGSVKLKVYNKANDDELDNAPYTQGVGVSFKKEFNNRHDLFARKKRKKLEGSSTN